MNKKLSLIPLALLGVTAMAGCNNKETIVILTAHETERVEVWTRELKQKFPQYNIKMDLRSTGNVMAELRANKTKSEADIVVGLEITNAEILLKENPDLLADLSDYDTSHYVDEVLEYQKDVTLADGTVRKGHKKYHIQDKEAGCIVYSKSLCGNDIPTSYNDLLDAKYKGKIIMPNPKSSGTGYYFYNGMASLKGKDAALEYFTSLNSNIKEWSTSGSGPVKGVNSKEIMVGLGMHFQAVLYANNNDDIGITYFEEGSPYSLYTMGMINGKQEKPAVKEVYDYFFDHVNYIDNCEQVPETIYKKEFAKEVALPNWKSPADYNVDYTPMKNLLDPDYKNELLDAWKL